MLASPSIVLCIVGYFDYLYEYCESLLSNLCISFICLILLSIRWLVVLPDS